jgi:hypothetical protein
VLRENKIHGDLPKVVIRCASAKAVFPHQERLFSDEVTRPKIFSVIRANPRQSVAGFSPITDD